MAIDHARGTAAFTPSSSRTYRSVEIGMSEVNPSRLITTMRLALANSGTSISLSVAKPYIMVSMAMHRPMEMAVSVERSLLRVALRNVYLRNRIRSDRFLSLGTYRMH